MTTAQPVRPRRVWDLILTIVLLVLHVAFVIVLGFIGVFQAFASDSCGAVTCNTDLLGATFILALLGPAVLALPVIIVAIVLLVKRRLAFWVPIVGSLLALGIEVLAWALAISAVGG